MVQNKIILLVGNTAWSMFNFRLGVAKALRSEGYEVIIAAPIDHTKQMIIDQGFSFFDLTIDNKGVSIRKDLSLMRQLFSAYKEIKPDLIIHYTIKPNIYGSIAAKLAGIKSIAFVTGLGSMFIKRTIITLVIESMYKFAFSFSKRVWFLNEEDYDFFVQGKIVSSHKAEILPGEGINTSDFLNGPYVVNLENETSFLFLGRILKDKGVYEYVEAARTIRNKNKNVVFKILGFIDALNPSAISREEVDQWVEEGVIEYLGRTSDVRPYIISSDCIVLPSYREGISRTLLEAASMERPIIATNVTGCKDIVDDGITGYLCKVKDSNDLSFCFEKFIKLSRDERSKMGLAGREKAIRQFDEKIIVEKYLKTMKELI